ncbi:hypothetical protein AZE42_12382 [Rhizopogon vesiculosus]|uniref:Ricin B lectin domain-containing protein n=1 Tax=Rhizopogon vesiculosus TaxID=180088 RepID=A0A1J8PR02_9AGAM|nr:hypothetical protein AZE42_12382 [Rhizopogon vesiculosus]
MSIPFTGTYRLRSVKFPNQLLDLHSGSAAPGTPVTGYMNNYFNQNMLWTMQVVDPLKKIVRLINVASGTFPYSQDASNPGTEIMGGPNAMLWKIAPRNNLGEYSIQTTDGQLAFSLANSDNGTLITLQRVDGNDNSQGWIFCPV